MSYAYPDLRPRLFTEDGVETLTKMRRNVENALRVAGAVRAQEAWKGVMSDSWLSLAALDYMVEKCEIREIPQPGVFGQHRIFVRWGDQ